jgi:hypothetical protein
MPGNALQFRDLVRISAYTDGLKRVRDCGDDELIDRTFNAACREIWGYTLDDFDDGSLSSKDRAWLDRMTWKRACKFAVENGYDLFDYSTGQVVTEWWGFTWMILAEKRGLLTPEGRSRTWRRHDGRVIPFPDQRDGK